MVQSRGQVLGGIDTKNDETADHDVALSLHKATGGDVRQFRIDRRIEIINFDQADADGVTDPADHRRISCRIQRHDNGGIQVIRRRQCAIDDCLLLRAILPVVVDRDRRVRGIVQFENGIGQCPETGREGPMARTITFFAWVPVMMKPPISALSLVPTLILVEMLANILMVIGASAEPMSVPSPPGGLAMLDWSAVRSAPV